jgi:hypothetical protein
VRGRVSAAVVASLAAACLMGLTAHVHAAGVHASARTPLPADRLQFGMASGPSDLTWMTSSGVPWKYRYAYLSAGVNTGHGWETWNSPAGAYATYYMNNSGADGYIPVFTYYELLQSNPSTGSNESDRDFSNLNNTATMNAYYANFKLLMQTAGTYGNQVVVHVEPDLWGYLEQRAAGGSASTLSASVASSGFADVTGLPNTAQGFAWALLKLRDLYAPNALLAIHASLWGSGIDLASTTDATTNPVGIADATAAFLNSAGIASNPYGSTWDAVFNDVDDHDAAWWEQQGADNQYFTHWWDPTNTRAPNFSRYLSYVAELHAKTSVPQVVWQVPIGNQYYLTMNNTCGHYQDNVAQYFIAHATDLFNAGLVGVLFGAGNACQTTNTDYPADGVTNNNGAPTTDTLGGCSACNTHTSVYSDNDGGFLRVFVGYYYWTAAYSMSPPANWFPGQTQNVTITLTNTGQQTWPHGGTNPVELDMHFTLAPGGSNNEAYWQTSQIFSLPSDVAPGGSATLTVPVTAPNTVGPMYLEAELFKNLLFWFQQWLSVPAGVGDGTWSAAYDMSAAPATWVAGQSQTFSVTVTNTGNMTWPHTGYTEVDLDLHFTTATGGSAQQSHWLTSQAFSLPNDVSPAASVTVSITLTAPTTTASPLWLEAEMIKEHQFWFTQVGSIPINVAAANWSAQYDLSGAPASWVAGQSQTFNVTVTNTGNTTWPHSGYTEVDLDLHFTTMTGGSAQQSHWLTSLASSLPADVAPSGTATVSVTLTAPTMTGSMSLEAEMIKEHQFWFTQTASVPVNVAPANWSAQYNLTGAPASWTAGQSQTFSVTVTNNGNTTWPHSGYTEVDLDLHFTTVTGGSAQESHWLTSLAFSIPNDVAPGASVTFSVTVTAPTTRGSMYLEAEMIKEHQFWFSEVAWIQITVS